MNADVSDAATNVVNRQMFVHSTVDEVEVVTAGSTLADTRRRLDAGPVDVVVGRTTDDIDVFASSPERDTVIAGVTG